MTDVAKLCIDRVDEGGKPADSFERDGVGVAHRNVPYSDVAQNDIVDRHADSLGWSRMRLFFEADGAATGLELCLIWRR